MRSMPIDPAADGRFSVFSTEDRQFLQGFFLRYLDIGDNFARFLDAPASERVDLATATIKAMPRRGWLRRGVREPESVYEHMAELSAYVHMYLPFFLPQDSEGRLQPEAKRLCEHVETLAVLHDLPEAIATDFTLDDPISAGDKHRVELLAAKVIFEHFPDQYALIDEYVYKRSLAARILHDFDKVHAVMKAAAIEVREPEQAGSGVAEEFLANVRDRMMTDIGRQLVEEVAAHLEDRRSFLLDRGNDASPQTRGK